MIEVEKKFEIEKSKLEKLLEGANFVGEKSITDSYYDNSSYSLTLNNIWLRKRDGKFQLKLPTKEEAENPTSLFEKFHELETDEEIAKHFGWKLTDSSLEELLLSHEYKPFTEFISNRRKYRKGDFIIDIDSTNFGYNIMEVELLVDDGSMLQEAQDRIKEFADTFSLEIKYIRGKLIELLYRKNREHFNALVKAGIVK
jgi:adenylate cyclase class IV